MEKGKSKYPGRPPRLGRVFAQSPLYFVTFNTHERKSILANDAVHDAFRAYAEKNLCRGFAMGRYVIMPDHIHFFVRVGMDQTLITYVRLMKQALTKALRFSGGSMNRLGCSGGSMSRYSQEEPVPSEVAHRATATTTKIWQPGFFDHVLRNHESYSEKWNYVRMNPVRAGLAQERAAWPFQGEMEHLFFD